MMRKHLLICTYNNSLAAKNTIEDMFPLITKNKQWKPEVFRVIKD